MDAHVVIGANFGDEGKGLVTDYLCRRESAEWVVRFNGGAQAGHTVVTPEGARHVFSHFGSGTLAGVPTFLSRFFVCNPALCCTEMDKLMRMPIAPKLVVDPECLVTTPWDMLINQTLEIKRADGRHGSCGVGFGETIERSGRGHLLTMGDIMRGSHVGKIRAMEKEWFPRRHAELGLDTGTYAMMERFLQDCARMAQFCEVYRPPLVRKRVVFEGAQGLLLDQSSIYFPHVTRSNTGIKNAAAIAEVNYLKLKPIYVTRTYLTRHGAGPLENEQPFPNHIGLDATNVAHPFQGGLRYAPMDWKALETRVKLDAGKLKPTLAVTWTDCGEVNSPMAQLVSDGPTHKHVR